jgi:hypothetical protein
MKKAHGTNRIVEERKPSNLTKGKSKLISIYTDKISQQPENCENRNDPDLVQASLKNWWVESDFKAPNLPLCADKHWINIGFFNNYMIKGCQN